MNIFNYITIGSMFLLTLLILIQTRGASLGAGLGGGGEVNTVRRGSDKTLHQITVALVVIFGLSIVLGIIV
ncbi:preprotein translocase subunit SecG [Candidatus Saccharibacteria bacterium RIFCSPHIGHO2_02_FULL_47_12]|nr:MAG: preprotein translocase subunit SecG [Candidatus Saccharibacteria bacterium RIFCSPHIGHO2_02_FULL_47_12]